MEVADTFGFLLGAWRVSRSIEDRLAKVSGSFEGSALLLIPQEWQARGVWARYDETGTLRFGDHCGPASRTLGYMRRHDGTVAIFFPDGSPYIDLDLRTGSCERDHPCREDLYHLEFTVRSLDEFEERWEVRGPEKDYVAITTLRREPPDPTSLTAPNPEEAKAEGA